MRVVVAPKAVGEHPDAATTSGELERERALVVGDVYLSVALVPALERLPPLPRRQRRVEPLGVVGEGDNFEDGNRTSLVVGDDASHASGTGLSPREPLQEEEISLQVAAVDPRVGVPVGRDQHGDNRLFEVVERKRAVVAGLRRQSAAAQDDAHRRTLNRRRSLVEYLAAQTSLRNQRRVAARLFV